MTFLERTRRNYAGSDRLTQGGIRLFTHEGVRAVDQTIDSCAAHGHCHRSRFRLGCVQPRLIIVVSRLAVPPDITVAMGAIQEVESLVTA